MGQRNMYNDAQVDMAEQNSLVLYGNTFDSSAMSTSGLNVLNSHDHSMYGSYGPSLIQGESSNLLDFYPLGIRQQTESNIPLYEVPNQLNQAQAFGHYMEGMPLSAASFSTILASSRGVPRSANSSIDDSNHSNSSTQTSLFLCPSSSSTRRTGGVEPFGSMINMDPNGWLTSHQDTNFRELSLSLATANPTPIQDQYSEMGCSSSQYNGPLSSDQTPNSKNQSWRCNNSSNKPTATEIPQLFSCSTYVHALQEILAALASYSIGNFDQINNHGNGNENQGNDSDDVLDGGGGGGEDDGSITVQRVPGGHGSTLERKKKRLLALLQVVDKQYNQCLDEIHTTVSAFHAVTELNPHIHARFALQTISNLYRKLREKISNHIISMGVNHGKEEQEAAAATRMEDRPFDASYIHRQWAIQQLRQRDHHLFRPQRGLPEKSVSVLKTWMFQNFLHPYPKDAEKHLLAVKSGLSRSQVSNWFINARVRIWRPMIEEMYAEMNRRRNRNRQNNVQEEEEETDDNQTSHVTLDNHRYSHH